LLDACKTSRKKEREPSHRVLTGGPAIAPECRVGIIRQASNPTQVEDEIVRIRNLLRHLTGTTPAAYRRERRA